MKKTGILAAVLVLTLMTLTACGCRNSRPAMTQPTTMPTTAPTTQATTVPTTAYTEPSTAATIPDGNGPVFTDPTAETDSTNARNGITGPSGNGITGSIAG